MADSGILRLPPLQQTLLDPATVEAFYRDITACTRVLAVIPKTRVRGHTDGASISLSIARAGLADGTFRAVQIRYAYENKIWCDTLMRTPDGIRLVRISEDDVVASVGSP